MAVLLQQIDWPPGFDEEDDAALLHAVYDWQITHSSLLKWRDMEGAITAQPIGASIWPTLFPKQAFEQAMSLQKEFNELYSAVACDEEWLYRTLEPLILEDSLASKLWNIHLRVKLEGYIQPTSLGIFRSDYMLHSVTPDASPRIMQVEFNTFSCAGSCHSSQISALHRHLRRTGAFPPVSLPDGKPLLHDPSALPPSDNITTLASALAQAHGAYGPPRSHAATETGILMVVQPRNLNVCDERPIEYALWERHGIPTYRVVFPGEAVAHTSLTESRELLFHPPGGFPRAAGQPPLEIALVYLRAGYDEAEYASEDGAGVAARLRLERSRAIKCPSVLAHLATLKKVQQALAAREALSSFVPDVEKMKRIAETFVPMYPLDKVSDEGKRGRKLALDPATAEGLVLKPSLEGGGHNIFGKDVPRFLGTVPEHTWSSYILMERIHPPPLRNVLVSPRGLYRGPVISELGALGVCMWDSPEAVNVSKKEGSCKMLMNELAGFTFKTKARHIDEMSVVKGYGCFDSPFLVDEAATSETREDETAGLTTD